MHERILPINIIPKNSSIIIYGAGEVGKKYYKDNSMISWCNIVGVIDKNAGDIKNFPIKVFSVGKVKDLQYEYILIARASLSGNIEIEKIEQELIGLGVDKKKIIYDISTTIWSAIPQISVEYNDLVEDTVTRICYITSSNLGDCVIGLKVYQTIIDMVDDALIDVMSRDTNLLSSIYFKQIYLNSVVKYNPQEIDFRKYDLVLKSEFEPIVLYMNGVSLKRKSTRLYECIEKLIEYHKKNYSDMPLGVYASGIRMNRARFWNLNRYTLQGCNGILPIDDSNVLINLDNKYKNEYDGLKISKDYITVCYGAGSSLEGQVQQTKVWPHIYFKRLIELIKNKYPYIKIIQVGAQNTIHIDGVDKAIIGREIELIKYVLKNAILHIDSDSGLVHLATQLGTKCVVMFGPTPAWFLGYEKNINIKPKICGECKDLIPDWYFRCLNYDEPECMKSISPEAVFQEIEKYFSSVEIRRDVL